MQTGTPCRRKRIQAAWALVATLVATARPAGAQLASVHGTLVNRVTRAPVAGARITVLGSALTAISDSTGQFHLLEVSAGIRVVQARAIGYATGSWMMDLQDGQTMRQEFELDSRALLVDSVLVTGEAYSGWRSEAGFDRRRAAGVGFFLGREAIQQRRAATLTDLLRVVPGVMTSCSLRGCNVFMERGSRPCRPEYYLDGFPASFSTGPNFPIQQIRGVEIYRDRFETPAEFQRPNLNCGVIAIWTIEPGTRLENH